MRSGWKYNFLHSLVYFHRKKKHSERDFSEAGSLPLFLSWEERENATFSICSLLRPLQITCVCLCVCLGVRDTCPYMLIYACAQSDLHTSVWYFFYAKYCQWQIAIKDWWGKMMINSNKEYVGSFSFKLKCLMFCRFSVCPFIEFFIANNTKFGTVFRYKFINIS